MASVHCVFCGLNLASIPAAAVYCTCGNRLPQLAAGGVASYSSAPPAAAAHRQNAAAPLPALAGPPGLFERLGAAILDSMFFSAFGASVKEFAASNPWEDILGVNSSVRILVNVLLGAFGWYLWNICWICYFGRNTATPGKFFLNLRVVDVETYDASDPLSGRPSVMQVIGRCFVQVLNVFCFADYLYALGNNRKQCLHDVFSGTAVVYVVNAEGRVRND